MNRTANVISIFAIIAALLSPIITIWIDNKYYNGPTVKELKGKIFAADSLNKIIYDNCEKRLTNIEKYLFYFPNPIKISNYEWTRYNDIYTGISGDTLKVNIDILSEYYRWKCNEMVVVDRNSSIVDFDDIIRSYSTKQELYNIKGIICIGTASIEGKIKTQEKLAKNRMVTLINLIQKEIAIPNIPIYGLNLGRYNKGKHFRNCSEETIEQRQIILLKITYQNKSISDKDLEQAIKEILNRRAANKIVKFPIDIKDYSKFEMHYGRNIKKI